MLLKNYTYQIDALFLVAYQQFDFRMLQTGQGRNSVYHVAIPSCIAVGLPCSSAKTPLHRSSKTTAWGSPRKIMAGAFSVYPLVFFLANMGQLYIDDLHTYIYIYITVIYIYIIYIYL